MNKVEFEEMLQKADKRYHFSEIEKNKIIGLLDSCHANDVRMTHRRMYEVFYMCDAIPGRELTLDTCSSECAKYGCSNCTAAEDAELLINQEKTVFELEPSDEFYFKDEVKSILKKYHRCKKDKMSDTEIDMIINELKQEIKCFNQCLGE